MTCLNFHSRTRPLSRRHIPIQRSLWQNSALVAQRASQPWSMAPVLFLPHPNNFFSVTRDVRQFTVCNLQSTYNPQFPVPSQVPGPQNNTQSAVQPTVQSLHTKVDSPEFTVNRSKSSSQSTVPRSILVSN